MNEFEFEKNLEGDLLSFFKTQELEAFQTRTIEDLGVDNVQLALDYSGALEDTRQLINGVHEYNTHEGVFQITINTYRSENTTHHERVAKVRSLMLNHNNGFKTYHVFDIQPSGATHLEFEETNHDQTQLNFNIKFRINVPNLSE